MLDLKRRGLPEGPKLADRWRSSGFLGYPEGSVSGPNDAGAEVLVSQEREIMNNNLQKPCYFRLFPQRCTTFTDFHVSTVSDIINRSYYT